MGTLWQCTATASHYTLMFISNYFVHRLRNLSDILDKHLGYLRAAVALESLSPDSTSTADAEPDESGGSGKDDIPPKVS